MINRIKYLRCALGLTQQEFGKKLGVSRDVIANIELNRVEPKETFLQHLCDVFFVNEDWILKGAGPVFLDTEHSLLSDLRAKYGLSNVDMDILKKYLMLEPKQQRIVSELINNLASLLDKPDQNS